MRILAVDDSVVSLATIEQELGGEYEVVTVNSGMRAIRYVSQEKPDLILLDIQMASKSGIETLRDIRAMRNGASIPVIMLTSKKDKDTVLESSRLGVYDYVLKPFNAEDLRARIRRTLKRAGRVPVSDSELYVDIRDVERNFNMGKTDSAAKKLGTMVNYQVDEEMAGRIGGIRQKLRDGDGKAAGRMLGRMLRALERRMSPQKYAPEPMDREMTRALMLCVRYDLEQFNIAEASHKLEKISHMPLLSSVKEICWAAFMSLGEYDDGGAIEQINRLLEGSAKEQ